MSSIYTHYRNRLIEISGKSRSLYSKTIAKKQAYNLGKIFENNGEEAKKFIEFLFSDTKRRFKLFNQAQIADFMSNNLVFSKNQKKALESEIDSLKALQREMDNLEKETGRYELFVGYPFVEGGIGGSTLVKAPLLLFPAKICDDNGLELEVLRDEPVLLNKVFALAYAKENKINTDDLNMEFDNFASEFKDIAAVKDYLAEVGFALKYPKQKQILNIETIKELTANDRPEIRNYAVLGRFPLANSIYNDYTQMEKNRLSSPALDVLIKNKDYKSKDAAKSKAKKTDYYPIQQLDYAQEVSIEHINKFSNVVIYGPPGTGKSQTITNMITDAICKNKRVLVVSQKRTALDVVYNRLGDLNSKAMILPDPEKSKNEFYEKVKARYNQAVNYKNVYSPEKMAETDRNLQTEYDDLKIISDSFFTPLPFGISLQEMYIKSARVDKNTLDYKVYAAMQDSPIINMNYHDLDEVLKSINQKNKANLYYNHFLLAKNNPIIDYIRTDLDVDKINRIKVYVGKYLSEQTLPFNIADYSHSRYMLVYNLENHSTANNLKPLADMITKLENPRLTKNIKISGIIPLLWPLYPVFKSKYFAKRREITDKLKLAQLAVRRYISEFDLLKTVLEPNGFAMVIDNITLGNSKFLSKLLEALDDYMALKDMILTLKSLSQNEKQILDFAFLNTRNKNDFLALLKILLPVRVYHEVIAEEKRRETQLAKTIVYHDIKNRITALKSERLKLTRDYAMDKFNDDFKKRLAENPEEGKNFLYQIGKQNKLWPIRNLMQEFESYLFELFPCWLLSPEAVSSILPLKPDLFDLVLFDEASQIFIENCIPAIYRSKCLVVSGDNKQLRPTNVFIKRYMGDDSYMDDMSLSMQAAMEVESLLDLAGSRLEPSSLTYHYRSKYEELINFSNYAFYNAGLQIAPNISRFSSYKPIERIKVNGRWIDRKNLVEAQAVVNLVEKIFKERKNNETIGIVTFNAEQEDCVADALDAKCKDSDFKSAYLTELNRRENGEYMGIFVKNLENVQGDERDIIIFSVAYAKNEEGKVNSQFGTLSMLGGENRLNVAITRAKEKIYVITSVEPEEFASADMSKNLGPKLFKKYLQYVRAISDKNLKEARIILDSLLTNKPAVKTAESSIMETELKAELEKSGYTVDLNLGNGDYKLSLAVYDPALDRYVLGIECDYTAKDSSDAIIERDVYRINFLESKGWKIMRIWSRDFWLNKPALIKAIEKEIHDSKFKILEENKRIAESLPQKKPKQPKVK